MNRSVILIAALAVVVVTAMSSLFTVHQTQQVLITQFGQPVRVVSTPGLHTRIPFIQTVIVFDRRLLDFDAPGEEVILGDQRRLIVDSFTRYSIVDPLMFFQTVGATEGGIRARLNSIVTSSLRRVLGNEHLLSVMSADRTRIMTEIQRQVNAEARQFGIEVLDVRIRRTDLPEENTQAILARMQSERERVAREARAEGAEVAQRVRAGAERERAVLLAEAQAQSDVLRGQGEEEAMRTVAEAFGRDVEFFQFWRSMQAYREAFADGNARMIMTPEAEFFRFLRGSTGRNNDTAPVPAAAMAAPAR